MNDRQNLLPCPFCDGEAEVSNSHHDDSTDFYIAWCSKCYAEGYIYGSKAEAIEAWNRRAKNE